MKTALITGVAGQDGFFLSNLLLEKGYRVVGVARKDSNNMCNINPRVQVCWADVSNHQALAAILQDIRPQEIYHLASQSKPGKSWACASETLIANGMCAVRLFEAVRAYCPFAKVYHASSSEMFGRTDESPQNENTPFMPVNPYAAAKVYAHQMARIYRESDGLFIANGILFNHESERRPLHFVTQKIAYGAACAALGVSDSPEVNEQGYPIVQRGFLTLGNLEVARDWGYAKDFVHAMWLMLQQAEPDDFIIGTGQLHTLQELCEIAYAHVGHDWRNCVRTDDAFKRPLEPNPTLADARKAKQVLGWVPETNFNEMVQRMVQFNIKRLGQKISSPDNAVRNTL